MDIHKDQSEKLSREDSQGLEEVFNENLKYLEESKMELLPQSGSVDGWRVLNHACETLFEEVTGMLSIEKHNLSMILDEQLSNNLNHLIDQTDIGLKSMANQLKNHSDEASISLPLRNAIKNLKDDLIRFRSTKATRKFELQDVEGFFVFFYTIVLIAEQLPPLEENIKKILSSNTTT